MPGSLPKCAPQKFDGVLVIAGKPLPISTNHAGAYRSAPQSGLSPAQRIKVRTAASALARDGRIIIRTGRAFIASPLAGRLLFTGVCIPFPAIILRRVHWIVARGKGSHASANCCFDSAWELFCASSLQLSSRASIVGVPVVDALKETRVQ